MQHNLRTVRSAMALALLVVTLLVVASCTTVGDAPATIPPTSIPSTSTVFTPGTVVLTTTTTQATTATLDRVAEIAALFEDLERRRLQAIFDQDEEAFRAVYANAEYRDRSLQILDLAKVVDPEGDFHQRVLSVEADFDGCIAATLERDHSTVLENGGPGSRVYVIELVDGLWGLSWVGEGWACDGPHPFS